MNFTKILTFAIIAMFLLVPFASAKQEVADSVKQNKKIDEKTIDKTKEVAKEISNKDKNIKGKVTVTDSNSGKYKVEKKSKTEISISKDEAKGEHTKSKVTFAKEDLQKIDVDGDKLYGVLHIADDGSTSHDVYTESQLTSGTEMIFSENIVNGYSGYWEKTQTGVTSGTTIDIPDVSGSDYYITTSVNGTIPTYTSGIPTNGLVIKYTFDNISGSTVYDDAGRNNNGTLYNGTIIRSWKSGNAMRFSGDDYIELTGVNSSSYTVYADINTTTSSGNKRIFSVQRAAGSSRYGFHITSDNKSVTAYHNGSSINQIMTASPATGKRSVSSTINATGVSMYRNGALVKYSSVITPMTSTYYPTAFVGKGVTGFTEAFVGDMDNLLVYNRALNASENQRLAYNGLGIMIRPVPSYNYTGYDVTTGTEKIIDTDSTCTGLEYVDTTGGTHTVTVRVYFTEDITKTTETKGAVYQNVSIIHTKQNASASVGTIAYELDPLYSGIPALTSNNTNATVSRNDTHVLISTGLVKQGQSFSYAVSVPDNHDHVIFLNQLMQWVGSGWDYVGVAPEDWTNAITDIEVTVS